MVCKFWLELVSLAANHGFSAGEINRIRTMIQENGKSIQEAWREHCG